MEILQPYYEIAKGMLDQLFADNTEGIFEEYPILNDDTEVLKAYVNVCAPSEKQRSRRDMLYLRVGYYGARKEGPEYAAMAMTLDGVIRELDR